MVSQTFPNEERVDSTRAPGRDPTPPNAVSLLEWLVARARQPGEPVGSILRRFVVATIDEVVRGLGPED